MSNRTTRSPREVQPPTLPRLSAQAGHPSLRVLLAALASVVLMLSGAGFVVSGKVSNSAGDLALGGGKGAKPWKAADGAQDILLVGIDSRSDAQGKPLSPEEIAMLRAGDEENENTDTIMLIRVPNDGSSATAISIPRDTYIHDDVMGNMKINGVYGAYKNAKKESLFESGVTDEEKLEQQSKEAGRKALISAVSQLSGVTVDHYAEVGLLGFVLLTNAVGGVEVCLNEAVNEPLSGANFPAGRQTLDGPDALSFVRQRHDLPRGDLDRIVRQQAFMASLVHKVLSGDTLSSPTKLNGLADAAKRSLTMDDDWDIVGLATQMKNLTGGNVKFTTIPVVSIDGVGDYGESVVTIDRNEVHSFFQTLLGDKDAPASESAAPSAAAQPVADVDVFVLNASDVDGLAGRAASGLAQLGYRISEVGNAADGLYTQSQIVAHDPADPAAKELAARLGGLPITTSPSMAPGEVTVVVTEDYAGPTSEEPYSTSPAEDTMADATATPDIVGQPGDAADPDASPVIDAGSDGPRCVN
ncbi:LytR family transcriptional regulator [Corynebacterium sp. 13CS0277]|uniref:LCP family protein n=1 Tax=Corynebacterium sp. 13CS0277 TaxID=2071994 RepID=UPI000D022537|nr:LCP family protein [Corynebacterium sp. 13CS0277]PRQ10796.1 LytR family transcriptional regulator [Corynebacterium sp. 13CS0277]